MNRLIKLFYFFHSWISTNKSCEFSCNGLEFLKPGNCLKDLIMLTSVHKRLMTKHDTEGEVNTLLDHKQNRRSKPKLDACISFIMLKNRLAISIRANIT